ncbi:bacteriophage holin [Saccharopolyspora sp. MS10]|uniref:bacteriophage holin n=1 Tax=Saccharopolyspora sp. MS10 TaxID=3385973 RepID=UPI0039A2F7E9
MPYVWSLVLFGAGVLLLLVLVIRFFLALRRTRALQREVTSQVANRSGLLRARVAGLRVALAERRNDAT